jgi:uncharacterized protein (DUF362 family)
VTYLLLWRKKEEMVSKVALLDFEENGAVPLRTALKLIGGIDAINAPERTVVLKVGVFDCEGLNHASVDVVRGIVEGFDKVSKVFVAESDNYRGSGLERLQIWKDVYSSRVQPLDLSREKDTLELNSSGFQVQLPRVIMKPNVLVDTHVLRAYKNGSILKNLFGCILDSKRVKFHKVLPVLLADVYEAVGGVDLAVLDGTFMFKDAGKDPVKANVLLVGKDAVAVEAVGAALAGFKLERMPVLQEFARRNLGETNIKSIEIVGASFDELRRRLAEKARESRSGQENPGPQTWAGKANRVFRELQKSGFFEKPGGRCFEEVVQALESRGISTANKENKVGHSLNHLVKKGKLKKAETSDGWVYSAD